MNSKDHTARVRRPQARIVRTLALSGCALFAIAGASAAMAQDSGAAPGARATAAEAQRDTGQLGEIIVTARKTNENVQTTPVSVTAVSAEQISTLNITRLDTLQQLTPNLTIVQNGPSSTAPLLYLRGIGSPSTALYGEPPVALYLDGVYTPRATSQAFDLPDLAGAEVLRGPQGTLFGRNTTGGAILIRTSKPTADANATLRASYGSDNDVLLSAVANLGEISPGGPRVKIVGQLHDRDGWVKFPGFDKSEWGGSIHGRSISGEISQDIGALNLEAAGGYNKLRTAVGWQTLAATPGGEAYLGQSASLGGPPFLESLKPLDITYRHPALVNNEATIEGHSARLTATYDAGSSAQLRSISAYSDVKEDLTGQLGGSYVLGRVNRLGVTTIEPVVTHVTPSEPGKQHQFSQEFNLSGKVSDFNYVLGLYYFTEHVEEAIVTQQISAPSSATSVVTVTDRTVAYSGGTKSYAGFGQLSYKPSFAPGLELTGGLRYTHDSKDVSSLTTAKSSATGITTITGTSSLTGLPASATTGIIPSTAKASYSNTGWSGSISYKVTPDVYVFARASSAFRSGGFNAGSTNAPVYGPEKAISYEAGIKTEFFDRHIRFNVVGFHTDYNGLQINQYFGPPRNTNYITNAGSAKYDGLEAELTARFGGFDFNADYGRNWPKYKTYLIGASPLPALCATTPNDPSCTQNVANVARFGFLSKTSFHVGAQYTFPEASFGELSVRADYSYKSSFRFGTLDLLSPNNTKVESGAAKDLSARVILSNVNMGGTSFTVQAFGENLLDHRYIVEAVDFSTTMNGIFNRPRNYGLIVTAAF